MIPVPRAPRCLAHHVWMAACSDCADQHRAEMRGRRTVACEHPVHADGCPDCETRREAEKAAADQRLRRAAR